MRLQKTGIRLLIFPEKITGEEIERFKCNIPEELKTRIMLLESFPARNTIDREAGIENASDADAKNLLVLSDNPSICRSFLDKGIAAVCSVDFNSEKNRGSKEDMQISEDMEISEDMGSIPYLIGSLEDVDYEYLIRIYERFHHIPWVICETERCVIRETIPEDVDAFFEIYADEETARFLEGLHRDRETEMEYQRQYAESMYRVYEFGVWTVLDKHTKEVIGRAGFSLREGMDGAELGYLIRRERQRRGLGYEVCSALLSYAEDYLGFEKIRALTDCKNKASAALLEKLGFRYFRDVSVPTAQDGGDTEEQKQLWQRDNYIL